MESGGPQLLSLLKQYFGFRSFRPLQEEIIRDALAPSVPLMALTATASERVRKDIVELLNLREPSCYVASFNRPNLTFTRAAPSTCDHLKSKFLSV